MVLEGGTAQNNLAVFPRHHPFYVVHFKENARKGSV
jgi:hypothetical protein